MKRTSYKNAASLKALTAALLLLTPCAALAAPDPSPSVTAAPSAPAAPVVETQPVASAPAQPVTQPIVHNIKLHSLHGNINLTVNPDGSYSLSGGFAEHKPGQDFDITIGLKSSLDQTVLFHWEGDAGNGVQFSEQGQSLVLKDNFANFAQGHAYNWEYKLDESAAARREHAEEVKRAREKREEEEKEAIAKHKKEVAEEKKQEARAEAEAELKWEKKFAEQADKKFASEEKKSDAKAYTKGEVFGEKDVWSQVKQSEKIQQERQAANSGGGGSSTASTVLSVAGAVGGALLSFL